MNFRGSDCSYLFVLYSSDLSLYPGSVDCSAIHNFFFQKGNKSSRFIKQNDGFSGNTYSFVEIFPIPTLKPSQTDL